MATKKKITTVSGRATPLRGANIDTDRIIPARYLKVTRFDTLGEFAFYDERFDADGNRKDHPLNDERYANSTILVVQSNFGSGSSREHAPQALMRHGFRAFIGESFAEIFQGNCLALGLPAITLPTEEIDLLLAAIERAPAMPVTIDITQRFVEYSEKRVELDIDYAACQALVSGCWDSTSSLLKNSAHIQQVADTLPYMRDFRRSE